MENYEKVYQNNEESSRFLRTSIKNLGRKAEKIIRLSYDIFDYSGRFGREQVTKNNTMVLSGTCGAIEGLIYSIAAAKIFNITKIFNINLDSLLLWLTIPTVAVVRMYHSLCEYNKKHYR